MSTLTTAQIAINSILDRTFERLEVGAYKAEDREDDVRANTAYKACGRAAKVFKGLYSKEEKVSFEY